MWDIIFTAGAAIIGGLIGYGIAELISKYLDRAIEWFNQAWNGIRRIKRAVGILIIKGHRLYKRFVTLLNDGEVEEYEDTSDEGVEVSEKDVKPEIWAALQEDGYVPIKYYE